MNQLAHFIQVISSLSHYMSLHHNHVLKELKVETVLKKTEGTFSLHFFLTEPLTLNLVRYSSGILLTNTNSRAVASFFSAESIIVALAFLSISTALLHAFVTLMSLVARFNFFFCYPCFQR